MDIDLGITQARSDANATVAGKKPMAGAAGRDRP